MMERINKQFSNFKFNSKLVRNKLQKETLKQSKLINLSPLFNKDQKVVSMNSINNLLVVKNKTQTLKLNSNKSNKQTTNSKLLSMNLMISKPNLINAKPTQLLLRENSKIVAKQAKITHKICRLSFKKQKTNATFKLTISEQSSMINLTNANLNLQESKESFKN